MAETALLTLAKRMRDGEAIDQVTDLRGTAYLGREIPAGAVNLPAYDEVAESGDAYNRAFKLAAEQANPYSGKPLVQGHGDRKLVVNPPSSPLDTKQLDQIYALPFTRRPHPMYKETIPAYEQIRFSITSHRGCCGGCAFCAITHHQGKTIQSRSQGSIDAEAEQLTRLPEFRGTITDIGGPTANMYGMHCTNPEAEALCRRGSCLYPGICKHLNTDDQGSTALLRKLRNTPSIKHVFVASGIRFDLLDKQPAYFADLVKHHVGGLLKVAPESSSPGVTRVMRKPGPEVFETFLQQFRQKSAMNGKKQAVIPYFISGHPGCTLNDMINVALFLQENNLRVEQVQEFTPTPGSLSTCIYYTGKDPLTEEAIHVPRNAKERRLQKALLLWHLPENRKDVVAALKLCGRDDLCDRLLGKTTGKPFKEKKYTSQSKGHQKSFGKNRT